MNKPLTLNHADLHRLEAAWTTLLCPLERSSLDEWRTDACRAVRDLLGAERSVFVPPNPAHTTLHGEGIDEAALVAYEGHFAALDLGLIRQRELGLEVWSVFDLLDRKEHHRTEIWSDWKVPNGIFGATGVTVEVGGLPAGLVCYDRVEDPGLEARQVQIMGLLKEAFVAGVRSYRTFADRGENLCGALDGLTAAAGICDARGRLVHANRRLKAVLGREASDERPLVEAIGRVAGSLGSRFHPRGTVPVPVSPVTDLPCRTSEREYRISASYLGDGYLPAGPAILVSVEVSRDTMPTAVELGRRLGLTRRQAAVALFLARGLTNQQLADALSISPHTARHHTENIFTRLNVNSRSQLVRRVMAVSSGPSPE